MLRTSKRFRPQFFDQYRRQLLSSSLLLELLLPTLLLPFFPQQKHDFSSCISWACFPSSASVSQARTKKYQGVFKVCSEQRKHKQDFANLRLDTSCSKTDACTKPLDLSPLSTVERLPSPFVFSLHRHNGPNKNQVWHWDC